MPRLCKNRSSQSSTASKRYGKSTTSSTTTTNFFKSTLVTWWARARSQRREAEERNKPPLTTTHHLHVALVKLTCWFCAWINHHLKYMDANRHHLISTATYNTATHNDKADFDPSFLKQKPRFWAISIHRATKRLWRFSYFILEHWISKGAAPSPPFWRKKRRGAHDTQTLNNNFFFLHFAATIHMLPSFFFTFIFFFLSLRPHHVCEKATFTVHYPWNMGILSNVYERHLLWQHLVIVWGVLFANFLFIVLTIVGHFLQLSCLVFFLLFVFFLFTIYRLSSYWDWEIISIRRLKDRSLRDLWFVLHGAA